MEKLLRKTLANGRFDNVTPERSRTMSKIRGKHNKTTELCLRMGLVRAGIRGFVLRPADLPGKPDFFFPRKRLAVFVDGCFWHGCGKCGHLPKTNSKFWKHKIQRNVQRDATTVKLLKRQNIHTIRIWEHELAQNLGNCIERVRRKLR